eukprot:TRINITY_DN38421_c0_g1_i1.p1 TRINITY_DN38421_c0_g1~~TRINITY_DN38421_c0_g1_i1.p1  ORF type:complete len:599 (+),score=108.47 TRINITY_DN38421_c0_g1_i1:71-1798(+)
MASAAPSLPTKSREGKVAAAGPHVGALTAWVRVLTEAYGWRLMTSIFFVQAVLKGFVAGGGMAGLIGTPVDFMLRERNVKASDLQVCMAAVSIPWSIKPLMGLLSDCFPLGGYRRLPYMAIATIGSLLACVAVGSWHAMPLNLLLLGLFAIFYQVSVSDLLSEAVYSRRIQEKPAHGPDLVSFVWGGIGLGKLVSTALVGAVIQYYSPYHAYLIALPVIGLVLIIPLFNLFEEERLPTRCFDQSAWDKDWPLFLVALLLGCGSLGLTALSLFGVALTTKVAAASILALVVIMSFSVILNPIIANVNTFFFVQSLFAVSTHGASFFFFTDNVNQYPDGPHLSTMFYTTAIGLVSTAFSLLGMFAYSKYMKHWRYPRVLVVSNLAGTAVNLLSCIVYLRWNTRWGISDRFFVLASSAVQTAIMELAWLPGVLMNSQLCPPGREATMFALLAGCHNLGANLANYFGAMLLTLLGVEPKGADGEQDQFQNLWLAALISAIGPSVPLLLLPWMIPNVSQTDAIEGVSDIFGGSLWQRFVRNDAKRKDDVESSSSDPLPDSLGAAVPDETSVLMEAKVDGK